ncbi:hypothetical protein QAD02_008061, partial [Eretmocerus hayati]
MEFAIPILCGRRGHHSSTDPYFLETAYKTDRSQRWQETDLDECPCTDDGNEQCGSSPERSDPIIMPISNDTSEKKVESSIPNAWEPIDDIFIMNEIGHVVNVLPAVPSRKKTAIRQKKVVWEDYVDIRKIWSALKWLKANNPLYENIQLPGTSEELLAFLDNLDLEYPEHLGNAVCNGEEVVIANEGNNAPSNFTIHDSHGEQHRPVLPANDRNSREPQLLRSQPEVTEIESAIPGIAHGRTEIHSGEIGNIESLEHILAPSWVSEMRSIRYVVHLTHRHADKSYGDGKISDFIDDDNGENEDERENSVYSISNDIRFASMRVSSAVFTKRGSVIEADKSIHSQLRMTYFSEGSPYETLHAMSKTMAPYFKSYVREKSKIDRDGDKMAPSVEKKIAELEMGLLHLQQNIDIPEISLPVHPLILQVIKQCNDEGKKPKVADFGARVEDSTFLNQLQNGVNRWIKEIQK